MRAIDADALLEKVEKIQPWDAYLGKYAQGIRHCMELVSLLIQDAPTIEPERETGEWIPVDDREIPYGLLFKCSKCDTEVIVNDALEHKFCSECGARMSGGK